MAYTDTQGHTVSTSSSSALAAYEQGTNLWIRWRGGAIFMDVYLEAQRRLGDTEAVIELAQRRLERNPNHFQSLAALGWAYRQTGQTSRQHQCIRRSSIGPRQRRLMQAYPPSLRRAGVSIRRHKMGTLASCENKPLPIATPRRSRYREIISTRPLGSV